MGVVISLLTLFWVSCEGLLSYPGRGGVVISLVTLFCVSCEGLVSYPGGGSDIPSHFILGFL